MYPSFMCLFGALVVGPSAVAVRPRSHGSVSPGAGCASRVWFGADRKLPIFEVWAVPEGRKAPNNPDRIYLFIFLKVRPSIASLAAGKDLWQSLGLKIGPRRFQSLLGPGDLPTGCG